MTTNGLPSFPQTIGANTVLGRTGIDAGPVQSLPFATLQALLGTGGGTAFGINVINVKNPIYAGGAVGDGVIDDTAAINAAIAAFNAAGKGVLYFPSGTYLVSTGLTAITAAGIVRGDGMTPFPNSSNFIGGTIINFSSATGTLFTVSYTVKRQNLLFIDLSLACTVLASAGAGISVTSSFQDVRVCYERIAVGAFYVGIDIQEGNAWVMNGCWLNDCILYCVKVQNLVNADAGDWCISNTAFFVTAAAANGSQGIHQTSSGGGKIVNCKFVGVTGGTTFSRGIDTDLTGSIDLLISNCSIESFSDNAIKASNCNCLAISNVQVLPLVGSNDAIHITSSANVVVSGVVAFNGIAGKFLVNNVSPNNFIATGLVYPTGTYGDNLSSYWVAGTNWFALGISGTHYFSPQTTGQLVAANLVKGARAMVSDSTVVASGNFGAIYTGGGINTVPIFSNGTNWIIG